MPKQTKKHGRYIVNEFSVIEFIEEDNDDRIFECIPDSWFTSESREHCFWPPKTTHKSIMIMAMNCERPDDSWRVYECRVVSGGHVSYAKGYTVLRDKCSQKYNTSSADDHIAAKDFRRKHPVLALRGDKAFESVFSEQASIDVEVLENICETNEIPNEMQGENPSISEKNATTGSIQNSSHVVEKRTSEQIFENPASSSSRIVKKPNEQLNKESPQTELVSENAVNTGQKSVQSSRSICPTRPSDSGSKNSRRSQRSFSRSPVSPRFQSKRSPPRGTRSRSRSAYSRHGRSSSRSYSRSPVGRQSISRSTSKSESNSRSRCPSSRRSTCSRNSFAHSRHERSRSRVYSRSPVGRHSKSRAVSKSQADGLTFKIDRLIKLLEKCDQRQAEHELRLTRLEVTLNKTFIMVGDLTKGPQMQLEGSKNRPVDVESEEEIYDYGDPKVPISSLNELRDLQKKLKTRRYKRFLVTHERDFCTPSKMSTLAVTMTKYLNRFVSMNVRCDLTLKEKSKSGYTLMGDFERVYRFLIEVFRAGYRMCAKFITADEAHTALRTVWGRSRQYKTADEKKQQLKRTNEEKRKLGSSRRRH